MIRKPTFDDAKYKFNPLAERFRQNFFVSVGSRRLEAIGIFLTHGVADTFSTIVAADQLGAVHESNPLVRSLLMSGPDYAAVWMLLPVLFVSVVWLKFGDHIPHARGFAITLIAISIAVVANNLWRVANV